MELFGFDFDFLEYGNSGSFGVKLLSSSGIRLMSGKNGYDQ